MALRWLQTNPIIFITVFLLTIMVISNVIPMLFMDFFKGENEEHISGEEGSWVKTRRGRLNAVSPSSPPSSSISFTSSSLTPPPSSSSSPSFIVSLPTLPSRIETVSASTFSLTNTTGVINGDCASDHCSFYPETDFFGGDLLNMPSRSKEQCCDYCRAAKSCKHWTYLSGTCFIKDHQVEQKPAAGRWAGKPCGNMTWKLPFGSGSLDSGSSSGSTGNSVSNTQSNGGVKITATKAAAPVKEKLRYPFTPGSSTQSLGAGLFASITSIFTSLYPNHDCCKIENDVDWSGADVEFERQESWEKCCEFCSGSARCKLWSYAEGICYLKHSKAEKQQKVGVISGASCKIESPTPLPPLPPERQNSQEAIKNAMKHAWDGYADLCFGQDELKPLSSTCGNWLGSGLTIIDAMSTLHLMNLTNEFERAKNWLAKDLKFDYEHDISFFETVIRIMGGLLSAYDFTQETVFLERAHQLADALMPAFESSSGLPWAKVNMATKAHSNPSWSGRASVLAEIGTIQLEYFALSHHLKNPRYEELAQHIVNILQKSETRHKGLYPLFLDTNTGRYKNQKLSFGGCGDSFYEYLLKVWLQTNRTKPQYQTMYVESINAMIQHMLKNSTEGYSYLPSYTSMGSFKTEMEHLTCFTPGMMALGAVSGIMDAATAAKHLAVAKELARTCYQSYFVQNTKVGPESFALEPSLRAKDAAYNMRPETIESLFYLWRITKDQKYRDWGWNIFVALERWCRRPIGYSGLVDVRAVDTGYAIDRQESYFLAETLKYLYLLFSEDDELPLMGIDDLKPNARKDIPYWIFNTEAHPLKAWNP